MKNKMKIRHEDLIGTFEQKKALVNQFNLMDDDFFAVVMKDKKACEYLISHLLDKKVKVIEVHTQYQIRNLPSHSVILDALIEDEQHKLYNVEIQVADNENHPKRVRYYQSSIDFSYLEKGKKYDELPDLYLIFISSFDPFKLSRIKYQVKKIIAGTDEEIDDGVNEFYFNTQVRDETQLSELLQYLEQSNADDERFGELSQAVRNQKQTDKGVDSMCRAVREYADERERKGIAKGKAETVKRLLDNGFTLDKALEIVGISKEDYEKYSVV